MNTKKDLDKKVNSYIDQLFSGVGESQQLFDLKEELATNLKEKISDYRKAGMDEKEAYREAVSSLGDLSGLVDDIREIGQDRTKQAIYTSLSSRVSTVGLITGILTILFGILTTLMLYFMEIPSVAVTGLSIFIVVGGAILTYSLLTRETRKKYAMKTGRAILYSVSVGLILFSLFVAFTTGLATSEIFTAISSFMVFFLVGVGIFLSLLFTGQNRSKVKQ
jgi:hypothetical protein